MRPVLVGQDVYCTSVTIVVALAFTRICDTVVELATAVVLNFLFGI